MQCNVLFCLPIMKIANNIIIKLTGEIKYMQIKPNQILIYVYIYIYLRTICDQLVYTIRYIYIYIQNFIKKKKKLFKIKPNFVKINTIKYVVYVRVLYTYNTLSLFFLFFFCDRVDCIHLIYSYIIRSILIFSQYVYIYI